MFGGPRREKCSVGCSGCPGVFLFNHYSRATYLDHGEIMYSPFPVRCPRSGGTSQAPLCPPPRHVPRRSDAHQGNDKGKETRTGKEKENK